MSKNTMDYAPLLGTLVGGFIALISSFGAIYVAQYLQLKNDRQNLKSAFVGEIRTILDMVETRGYLKGYQDDLSQMKARLEEGEALESVEFTTFRVGDKFFRVWDRNVDKIGILEAPLPEQIVLFYTATHDGTAKVWDVATRKLLASLEHQDSVSSAGFSPDGTRIVTASNDGTATIWYFSPETRTADEISAIIEKKVPFRLEDGVLAPR